MTNLAADYGGALYSLSTDSGTSAATLAEIKLLDGLLRDNPDYIKLLCSPMLPKQERVGLVDAAFSAYIGEMTLNLLKLLTEKRVVFCFSDCVKQFERLYNDDNNIEKAVAVTAVSLTDALMDKLSVTLSEITKKKIMLTNEVQPDCIGGLIIRLAGSQLDASVKSRLEALKERMIH